MALGVLGGGDVSGNASSVLYTCPATVQYAVVHVAASGGVNWPSGSQPFIACAVGSGLILNMNGSTGTQYDSVGFSAVLAPGQQVSISSSAFSGSSAYIGAVVTGYEVT